MAKDARMFAGVPTLRFLVVHLRQTVRWIVSAIFVVALVVETHATAQEAATPILSGAQEGLDSSAPDGSRQDPVKPPGAEDDGTMEADGSETPAQGARLTFVDWMSLACLPLGSGGLFGLLTAVHTAPPIACAGLLCSSAVVCGLAFAGVGEGWQLFLVVGAAIGGLLGGAPAILLGLYSGSLLGGLLLVLSAWNASTGQRRAATQLLLAALGFGFGFAILGGALVALATTAFLFWFWGHSRRWNAPYSEWVLGTVAGAAILPLGAVALLLAASAGPAGTMVAAAFLWLEARFSGKPS